MVKDHLPSCSRDMSPDQPSCLSHLSVQSRISSRASTAITCSTRESSPEYRLEILSISSSSSVSPLPPQFPAYTDNIPAKTSIPSDSPLFSQPSDDETRKRFKNFNKTVRRARSFRAARERIQQQVEEPELNLRGQEVTFLIKKSLAGRIGWKIMPEDEKMNMKMNKECVEQVMERIRDLQFTGETVPDEITIVVE
eukprot:GFUD01001534.1.p1 GENE.GFUD01001534.1~~GFUD01001534.1.p1  ORF type:complete len:196 (-),score=72.29 GFUD01001534.1:121-708(-)